MRKEHSSGSQGHGITRARTTIGIFEDRSGAECAMNQLLNEGFSRDYICLAPAESKYQSGAQSEISKSGQFLLAVQCDDQCDRAQATFTNCGATSVSPKSRASTKSEERTSGGTTESRQDYIRKMAGSEEYGDSGD
jgi:hypothetical protein